MSDEDCPYEACGNPSCALRRKLRDKAVALLASQDEPPHGTISLDGNGLRIRYDANAKTWKVIP